MMKELCNGVFFLFLFTQRLLFCIPQCSSYSNIASLSPSVLGVNSNTQNKLHEAQTQWFPPPWRTQSPMSISTRLDGKFHHNILTIRHIALPPCLTCSSLVSSFALLSHSLVRFSTSSVASFVHPHFLLSSSARLGHIFLLVCSSSLSDSSSDF